MPPSNILHATTDPAFLQRLKEMFGSSARADIAVGFFFMSGFDAVADDLAQLERVRILVGRTDRQVFEEVAVGLQQVDALGVRKQMDEVVRRSDRSAIAQDSVEKISQGVSTLPQNSETEAAVGKLREMVASGQVRVRTYVESPLHAKAYLCWYDDHAEPGSAVVGSSNFTLAGFTGNTELNVRVTGDAEMFELGHWFDELWGKSVDISDQLVTVLDRSWAIAKTPPYHVYLKALHELYREEVGRELTIAPSRAVELANFQLDAVSRGMAMIESFGGCYIGDVVGLGKTFIGAELLRQLQQTYPDDGPPLILCPAGLRPMWSRVNEDFGLGAEVVSHSMIAAPVGAEFDEELGRYVDAQQNGRGIVLTEQYPNRGPVLVDEAHNFRNINLRSSGLRDYLDSRKHKVVLLSATPQNMGPRDILRQLRLFLGETDHGIDIEPLALTDFFNDAEKWMAYLAEKERFEEWQRNGGDLTDMPKAPIKPVGRPVKVEQVLTHVFIRRRRKDINELYDSAEIEGNPVEFPEPVLDNVNYRLDKVYAKAGKFDDLQKDLRKHKGFRYRVTDYIKDDAADKPEYADLFRAQNRIARLMAVLLLKRLESSIEAFRSTLDSLIRSNRNFREALTNGFVPIGSTATRMLAGESFDADTALDVLQQEEDRRTESGADQNRLVHSVDDFNVGKWFRDLDADFEVLDGIRRRVSGIGPEDDDKLTALRHFLERSDVKNGKVLIFSEAETTVEYLYGELTKDDEKGEIARLTGSNRDSAENILKRFSPTWNLGSREHMRGAPVRVLLATDVVSEGQNLQDCARVLNYDLHWNPVRLIQRFGRVDRIGTEHDQIFLNNMWPDTDVDEELELTVRLTNRIQAFHDVIGLDNKLLSESERLNQEAMYRIYSEKELPEIDDGFDELAVNQRAIALLQRIQEEDEELWQTIENLPDAIRSALTVGTVEDDGDAGRYAQGAMAVEGSQMPFGGASTNIDAASSLFDQPKRGETLVLLESGGYRGCYAVGRDLQPRAISAAQFIEAAACEPDTPGRDLPRQTNERVMAAFEEFKNELRRRLGRSRQRIDTRNRRYISRELNIARDSVVGNASFNRRISDLRAIFLNDVSDPVDRALTEIRNLKLVGETLVRRLEALRERFRLNPPRESELTGLPTPEVVRIVCSDGLVD